MRQVASHSDRMFSFYRANIHTRTSTYIHTHTPSQSDRNIRAAVGLLSSERIISDEEQENLTLLH